MMETRLRTQYDPSTSTTPMMNVSGNSTVTKQDEGSLHRKILSVKSRTYTLLLVDDEPDHLFLFEMLLAKQNHRTLLATSGRQALNILRKRSVDLVICDLRMPEMDGIEFVSRMRRSRLLKDVPVIMLTAAKENMQMKALVSGADVFCLKSAARKTLGGIVELLLSDRG